jgi:hypothetical protein
MSLAAEYAPRHDIKGAAFGWPIKGQAARPTAGRALFAGRRYDRARRALCIRLR